MKQSIYFLTIMALLLSTSCNTYKRHVTHAYYKKASPTTKLAIIPVLFTLTGPIVNRISEEKILQVADMESYHFQSELATRIIRKMGTRKRKVSVNLQDINTTNKLLAKSGYSKVTAFNLSPQELGEILDVDAVMLVDIKSNQLFTSSESAAIKTGTHILEGIFGTNSNINYGGIPTGSTTANASIIDTKSNTLLWANHTDRTTKVKRSSKDTNANINYVFGRTFPFRNKDFAH